jgi:hypothetical protein
MSEDVAALFAEAAGTTGPAYVKAERRLRALGPPAAAWLRSRAEGPGDPVDALAAGVIAELAAGEGGEYDDALEFIDRTGRRLQGTILDGPRPDVLAADLTHLWGGRLTRFLAARLAREPEWPAWKTETVLLYLAEHRDEAALPALFRFASTTADPTLRNLALAAVGLTRGPGATPP